MMKRKITQILLVILTVVIIAGCTSNNNINNNSPAASNDSSTKKNVALRFSWWGNDARNQATVDVINLYMTQNPHVKIEAEFRGESGREKVATALAGGTVADIVQLNPPWMSDFTNNSDFFIDLNEYKDLIDLSGFDSQLLADYGTYNDQLIALPTGINARISIINKDLAQQFNIPTTIDTKWSWNDLHSIGKQVNQKDSSKYMLNIDTIDMTEFVLRPYLVQKTGNQLVGDDLTLGFTRDDLLETLTYINSLYMDKVAIPASEANVFKNAPQTNPKWINGDMVLALSHTSLIPAYTDAVSFNNDSFIVPIREDAKNSALVVQPSQLIAVSKQSTNVDEALKFLDFFFNDIQAGKILKDVRSIPPIQKIVDANTEDNLLNPKVVAGYTYGKENMGLYQNSLSTNAEFTQALQYAVEEAAYPNADMERIVDRALKLIEDILKTLSR
jgi:oligogalacturonide transport system substrate-binding protein